MYDGRNEFSIEPAEYHCSGLPTPNVAKISALHQDNHAWRYEQARRQPICQPGYIRFLEGMLRRKDAELRTMRNLLEQRIREESEI